VDAGERSSMWLGTLELIAKKHRLLLAFCVLLAASPVLATSPAWAAKPNIDVEGQGISIADGDLTPNLADDTDFGATPVSGGTVPHVFTIRNEGTGDLEVTAVIASGAHAADFSVSGIALPVTLTPAGATSFTVTFDPSTAGLRSAAIDIAIDIANDDPDENPYDFSIQGTGILQVPILPGLLGTPLLVMALFATGAARIVRRPATKRQ
jgi:hypothetical protein